MSVPTIAALHVGHRSGHDPHGIGCKGVAWWWDGRPSRGEMLGARAGFHLDGSKIPMGELMRCGSCGCQVAPADVEPVGGWA